MQKLPIIIRTCLRVREILNAQKDEKIKIRGTLPTDVKLATNGNEKILFFKSSTTKTKASKTKN